MKIYSFSLILFTFLYNKNEPKALRTQLCFNLGPKDRRSRINIIQKGGEYFDEAQQNCQLMQSKPIVLFIYINQKIACIINSYMEQFNCLSVTTNEKT